MQIAFVEDESNYFQEIFAPTTFDVMLIYIKLSPVEYVKNKPFGIDRRASAASRVPVRGLARAILSSLLLPFYCVCLQRHL